MATRVIDDSKLQDIAVAIQGKDGGGQMTVDEMPGRIQAIPSGGGTLIPKTITENGVYNAANDNADGYDVVTVAVPERNTLDECFADTLEVANIPSAISITPELFYNRKNLIGVIMPNVTTIGNSAFSGCTNLALTSLPSGVTSVGRDAFRNCTNLALTSLPSGLTDLSTAAFWGCTNLALTSLPDGMTNLNIDVFSGCINLALTSLPSGVREIRNYAFSDCRNITLNKLPATVTSIGNYAFNRCTGIPYLDFSNFDHIPTIVSTTFNGTTFPFYFADQTQLDAFASATNWSTYADRFQIKPSGVI